MSHNLPSVSWRTWKTGGVIQSGQQPEHQEHGGRAEAGCPLLSREQTLLPLALFRPSLDWIVPTALVEGATDSDASVF